MESTTTITKLNISTHKDSVPIQVYAVFNDGRHLTLDYQRTWQQCFASLSGNKRTGRGLETAFLHHIKTDGINSPWATMTREDWANVCFAYRMEMEDSQ